MDDIENNPLFLQEHCEEDIDNFRRMLINSYHAGKPIYYVNDYLGSDIDKHILENTDKANSCSSLILSSPTILCSYKKEQTLRDINIYDAKKMLTSIIYDKETGVKQNGLIARLPYVGVDDGIKIRDAINFYEEQVLRQAKDADCLSQNLFTLNQTEKTEIVFDHYNEIVDYFVDTADKCVWGGFPKNSKLKLQHSIKGTRFENLCIRANFIKIIADYTTLSELEKGPVKSKVLDRFIIK